MPLLKSGRLAEIRTGVICNPGSGRARKRLHQIRSLAQQIPTVDYRETISLDDIGTTIDVFIANKIELLIIIGGDGTVQKVLNHLFTTLGITKLPLLSVIPAGTTNMTAKDLGTRGRPVKILKRLVELLNKPGFPELVSRPVLHIQQGTAVTLFGMFFGAGIIASGARYFHDHIKTSGITGEFVSALVICRLLASQLLGRPSSILTPVQVRISDDKDINRDSTCLLLFASTMDRLLLGMRPYWGHEGAPIHTTYISRYPARLWRSLLAVLFGRGNSLAEEDGYYSRDNHSLELLMDGDYIVDGEFFKADSQYGPLQISATEEIYFLLP